MMQIAMTLGEKRLLESVLRCSQRYLEFGSGGSTCLAAALVKQSVTSVDSSQVWLDRVGEECRVHGLPVTPTLLHVDIGETGDWGYPVNDAKKDQWPEYHRAIWADPEASKADLYLVDGRFRVACFMQVLLHSAPDALIAIHDFANRPNYHVVHELAREVARAENLSVFIRKADFNRQDALDVLDFYAFNPR